MQPRISIKPHHFVDVISSFAGGETTFRPHPYGHAVHSVSARILHDRDVCLEIELGMDDICQPCVHNIDGVCDDTIDTSHRPTAPASKGEWNLLIDRRWCERLGVEQGDQLTAGEFCERIRDKMGDITDIYREVPAQMTAQRSAKLVKGIECYLGQGGGS